jgi:membrane protease YdiL (CAAX protease family)
MPPEARPIPIRGIALYLLVTFVAAWAIELWPVRHLAAGRQLHQAMAQRPIIVLLLVAVMYTPALGAVVARLFAERGNLFDSSLRPGPFRYYVPALFLPVLISIAAGALSAALGLAKFDPHFTGLLETIQRLHPERPVRLPPPWMLWTLAPLQVLTFGVAITSLATFGEEFGWRGYLQPKLAPLGALTSMLLTGIIWGLWHPPAILQGHNYPTHPRLGVPLFVAFCIVWGVILGWLRLHSGSIWPCVVAHASLNSMGSFVMFVYFRDFDTAKAMLTGIVGIAIAAVVAAALLVRDAKHPSHARLVE